MEQTKAIILHRPKTATVPGHSVITVVHMLLASCLHCFAFFFPFAIWKNPHLFVFWEIWSRIFFFFFFYHTHTFGERKRHRQSEAADLSKIKPFFFFLPPISLESQSVLNDFQNRRWFVSVSPLDFVCRIERSKGHAARLRWALIAWTPAQSLNTVVWMSLPACQLKTTRSKFLLSLADATHGETLAPPTDCD